VTQLFMIALGVTYLVFGYMAEPRSLPFYANFIMAHIWFAANLIYAKVRRP